MADIAVTNMKMEREILETWALTPATADVIDETEVFAITPDRENGKCAIVFKVGPTNGAVAYSIAAGSFWAAGVALTGSVDQDTTVLLYVDNAKFMDNDGKIKITLTPATGKKLLTDHIAEVGYLELP